MLTATCTLIQPLFHDHAGAYNREKVDTVHVHVIVTAKQPPYKVAGTDPGARRSLRGVCG